MDFCLTYAVGAEPLEGKVHAATAETLGQTYVGNGCIVQTDGAPAALAVEMYMLVIVVFIHCRMLAVA